MKYKIALDVGATKTLAGLMLGKKVIKKIKKPTGSKGTNKQIINNMVSLIEKLWLKDVKQIGIGLAGQIDEKKGIVISTGNFNPKFSNIKLAKILKDRFKVEVKIDNDVKCFTLAENKWGWGKQYDNYICLTFGTGIGGAMVIDKKLFRGQNNLAGEVGHMKIAGSWIGTAPLCGCSQKYCWESLASGRAWQKIAKKHSRKKADQIIISNIAVGLNNLATIFSPQAFIIGGGLTEHANLISKIKKEFNQMSYNPLFKQIKIIKPKLADEAILLGSLL